MKSVRSIAGKGIKILGICNGFQILCEAGLLPGVLLHNKSLNFVCKESVAGSRQYNEPVH